MFRRRLSSAIVVGSISIGSSPGPASGEGVLPIDAAPETCGACIMPSEMLEGSDGSIPKWPPE